MNILVIGSGGREHAICNALKKSANCKELYCLPGNAGIEQIATCVKLRITDFDAIVEFCRTKHINLVVVGPESPLVAGIEDFLEPRGIKVFGPSKAAARLEASKAFTKEICAEAGIPTAKAERFSHAPTAKQYVKKHGAPIVIKADGLAAGKGVVVAQTVEEALEAIDEILVEKIFGEAGTEILVEDFMEGREASFFALVTEDKIYPFGTACDYKRVGDGNTGPNTGGMGTFSPADMIDEKMSAQIMDTIIYPTLKTMAAHGSPFKGFLFAGLMMTQEGPKLIEYNCRMGDPETQSILPRLESDLLEVILGRAEPKFSSKQALTVVVASNGYPADYETGSEIKGLEKMQGVNIFHAGTTKQKGKILSNGGRVLGINAVADSLAEAKEKVYSELTKLNWPQGFYRKDIGEIYG